VESDFWRTREKNPGWKKAIRASISEFLNRLCVRSVDAAFFTHQSYMDSLLTVRRERGFVSQASWIDDDFILSDLTARDLWHQKLAGHGPLKIAFVGRLIPEKGADYLLDSLEMLNRPVVCEVIGKGQLLTRCKQRAARLHSDVAVYFLDTIDYGAKFFKKISEYDAIIVPSVSNEQPRIVYDAFARAVPIIGFRTDGLASCVADGKTGRLCEQQNARELAALLNWAATHRDQLATMGMAALGVARSSTHRHMHQRRSRILAELTASPKA
jgi:glycosyltransferase involved in cell wall biosynthesis